MKLAVCATYAFYWMSSPQKKIIEYQRGTEGPLCVPNFGWIRDGVRSLPGHQPPILRAVKRHLRFLDGNSKVWCGWWGGK